MKSLAAVALVATSVSAFAQREKEVQSGSLVAVPKQAVISDEHGYSVADRGRVAMAQFARCVVDRRSTKLQSVLTMPIGPQYEKVLKAMATDHCLANGQMSFHFTLFRGSIFAELWRRRVAADRNGQKWGPVLDPVDLTTPIDANAVASAKVQFALQLFAECIVKRDRRAASDVVLLPIASKAQSEAYSRLSPSLAPCLPKGQQAKFSKPMLEGILAEILYRSPLVPIVAGVR